MAKSTASYRVKNTIPVCSGISGLGKSVCWKKASTTTLRDKMKLDGERIFSVIVPYYSGFIHHPVEKLMPIQASFSWRLLYRFFRDNNCPHGSKLRLLVNGHELTFASAVKAIELKLRRRQRWKVKGAPLYLFLFDEYQAIENARAQRKQPNTSLLRELVEAIGTFLCAQSPQSPSPPSLVVLPMFAGTDWGVIQSISNSSCVQTEQLPMALFTMDQMFKIVESNANYAGLLECAQTRRGLFALGVPRWVVECLAMMKKACGQAETASLATIKGCFSAIWSKYVSNYLNVLTPEQRIRLAASAIAGRPSWQDEAFDGTIKWSKLRDSSLCC